MNGKSKQPHLVLALLTGLLSVGIVSCAPKESAEETNITEPAESAEPAGEGAENQDTVAPLETENEETVEPLEPEPDPAY